MKASLMRLLDLQDIDSRIDKLKRLKTEYPGEISALQSELELSRKSLEDQKERERELEKERRHFERELEVANIQLKKHQARLDEVKTNKEYEALQREIRIWENNVSENETQVLRTMAELEELSLKIENESQEFERIKSEKENRIDELTLKLSSVEQELSIYRQKRDEAIEGLGKRLLSSYERIRRGRGGMAVVPIRRGACGGCFKQIPPQKVVEIKRNERLITCENCGRILVWDERNG
ncbi:MAG TPA: hypothetical protein EYP53_02330 [Candidatus Latescibacteria bacterium]|nr:hypothetical protein [Candidatus Latescibacterota bacterium]